MKKLKPCPVAELLYSILLYCTQFGRKVAEPFNKSPEFTLNIVVTLYIYKYFTLFVDQAVIVCSYK